eukprot:Platyproteum_vivax@DN16349_c0_g1_i1.p1
MDTWAESKRARKRTRSGDSETEADCNESVGGDAEEVRGQKDSTAPNTSLHIENYLMEVQEHFNTTTFRTFIDARWKANAARYINHSCTPNLEASKEALMFCR